MAAARQKPAAAVTKRLFFNAVYPSQRRECTGQLSCAHGRSPPACRRRDRCSLPNGCRIAYPGGEKSIGGPVAGPSSRLTSPSDSVRDARRFPNRRISTAASRAAAPPIRSQMSRCRTAPTAAPGVELLCATCCGATVVGGADAAGGGGDCWPWAEPPPAWPDDPDPLDPPPSEPAGVPPNAPGTTATTAPGATAPGATTAGGLGWFGGLPACCSICVAAARVWSRSRCGSGAYPIGSCPGASPGCWPLPAAYRRNAA